jgi:sugar phosphate permease
MPKRIHWAWVILATSFVTILIHRSIGLSYGILMPEMIASLKITKTQAGAIASSYYLTYTIFSPLLGFLVDRVSARKLLAASCFLLGTGAFLMGKPTSLLQACLFFSIVAIAASGIWTPLFTLVQRWFGIRHRGMAVGILSSGLTIGYGIMGIILPPLVARFDWRTCWLLLSFPAFALVLVNGIFVRTSPQELGLAPWGEDPRPPAKNPLPAPPAALGYRGLLKIRGLWPVAISYFCMAFSAYSVVFFIVTYGTMELKLSYARAASLASAIAASGFLGALLFPLLSDFAGRKRCLTLINLGLSASILLIIAAGHHWNLLLFGVCLFGLFYASVWPIYAAVAGDFAPAGATGSVLGFWTIFYGLGVVMAGLLGGYIADLTGTFARSFLVAAFAGALGTLFLAGMKTGGRPGHGAPS